MSFRLVPKSVTLNDLERRNGRYFALFHGIRVRYFVVKQLGLPRCENSTFDSPWPYYYNLRNKLFGQNKL